MEHITINNSRRIEIRTLEGLACNLRYTLNKSETYFQFNRTVCKDKYSNIRRLEL